METLSSRRRRAEWHSLAFVLSGLLWFLIINIFSETDGGGSEPRWVKRGG